MSEPLKIDFGDFGLFSGPKSEKSAIKNVHKSCVFAKVRIITAVIVVMPHFVRAQNDHGHRRFKTPVFSKWYFGSSKTKSVKTG